MHADCVLFEKMEHEKVSLLFIHLKTECERAA